MPTPISTLPDPLREALEGRSLIVFDGVCVLCSGFFKFVLKRDHKKTFSFATAQSPLGTALYQALDMPTDNYSSNLVITYGQIHTDLSAFAAVMALMPWPWRGLAIAGYLPVPIRWALYTPIARNRYRIFGKSNACMIPSPDVRARFLPDGWSL